MITFPCMCRFELEVPDELAGGLIQCPRCSRLCDVPTLDEAAHLRDDGTIELEEANEPAQPEPDRLQQLHRAFEPSRRDASGEELDLRLTPEEIADVGAPPDPDRPAPKYDPVTGELVRPLELKLDPDLPDGPIPVAKAALTYSTDRVLHGLTAGKILLELFMPVNVFVMFFAYLGHIAPAVAIMLVPAHALAVLLVLLVIVAPVTFLILAHYGNVIQDTGPDGLDELHRPLRDFALWDDLMAPFGRVFLALGVCYGPAVYFLASNRIPDAARPPLAWTWATVGTILLPALLLTTVTSGTFLNLRPDRVLGVIRACGAEYVWAALASFITMGIYFWNAFGTIPDRLFTARPWLTIFDHPVVNFTLLAAAVYFGHFFAWLLGMLYRRHHGQFPWLLQRHVPKPKPLPPRNRPRPTPVQP